MKMPQMGSFSGLLVRNHSNLRVGWFDPFHPLTSLPSATALTKTLSSPLGKQSRLLASPLPKVRGALGPPCLPSTFPPAPGRRQASQWRRHGRRRRPPPAAVVKPPRATFARAAAGNPFPVPPSSFSPSSRSAVEPQAAAGVPPPPLFHGKGEEEDRRFCTKTPAFFSILLRNLPPL